MYIKPQQFHVLKSQKKNRMQVFTLHKFRKNTGIRVDLLTKQKDKLFVELLEYDDGSRHRRK